MSEERSSLQARLARAVLAMTATAEGSLLPPEVARWLARVASGAQAGRTPREVRRALVREALALYRALGERARTGPGGWIEAREPGPKGAPIAARVLPRQGQKEAGATYRQLLGLIRRLNHPNLASLVEAGEEGGLSYLMVRLAEGLTPLTERLREGRPWKLRDALQVALKAADALAYAHEQGLIHGFLGSDQIFVSQGGQVMVRGVGLSQIMRAVGLAVPKVRTFFTPPEVVAGAEADARSDVYALGALLYLLLTQRGPARDAGRLIPASRFNPDVWPELDQVLEVALALQPGQRFATAKDFAWALRVASREPREVARKARREAASPARGAMPSHATMPARAEMPEIEKMPVTAAIVGEGLFPEPLPMPEVDISPLEATAQTFETLMIPKPEMPQPPPIPEVDWEALLAPHPVESRPSL